MLLGFDIASLLSELDQSHLGDERKNLKSEVKSSVKNNGRSKM